MRAYVLGTLAGLAFTACGGSSWYEELRLIPDSEIDAMQSEIVASATEAATPGAAHVKVVWGYLAGKFLGLPGWVDWSGSLAVDSGKATLESLVYFDRHDAPRAQPSPGAIEWTSRTLPHYDGFVALVEPAGEADVVRLATAAFSADLSAAELARGVNQHYVVDADGHEVSVTSVPAGACGGFAYGYQKRAKAGWLGFGGRITDPSGKITGRLRFRADGSAIRGRVLDESRQVVAEGTGTLDGEKFELTLDRDDGSRFGTVRGVYQPPSYAVRGAFQATWSCE